MKIKKISGLIIVLFITALLVSGCGGSSYTLPAELEQILNKIDNVNEIRYDVVTTLAETGESMTMQIWLKVPDMRIEINVGGRDTVLLADMEKKTGYTYIPAGGVATVTDFGNIPNSIKADTKAISEYQPEIIGQETLDGKSCTVFTGGKGGVEIKAWIWNDYGIMLRQEVTKDGLKSVVEVKNIDFSAISDSVFELPDGVLSSDWFETTPAN